MIWATPKYLSCIPLTFIYRHTSTASYVSILKLLKNMSYYSYFRKAWKKDVFELLLLEPGFFQMIKPHYYYTPISPLIFGESSTSVGDVSNKAPENQCVVQIWKVIMDNLFTQDKSSFSELLSKGLLWISLLLLFIIYTYLCAFLRQL